MDDSKARKLVYASTLLVRLTYETQFLVPLLKPSLLAPVKHRSSTDTDAKTTLFLKVTDSRRRHPRGPPLQRTRHRPAR